MKRPVLLLLVAALASASNVSAQIIDFNYGFSHVNAPQADIYLHSSSNARKYSEWQSPAVTYWGPSANDIPAELTYRFDFGAPSAQVEIFASLASFNFVWGNANGWFGSGTGSSSLWASKDGADYTLLLNNPMPASYVDSYLIYSNTLPLNLLGSSSLYVQVRMQVSGSPNGSYTTAQFSRSSSANPSDVFRISATTVPEPSTYALLLMTGAGALWWAKRKR
ncbi:MAG: PEP-CTERM sorting domain-containing protein [Sphaerospermopsis kisseleviana]